MEESFYEALEFIVNSIDKLQDIDKKIEILNTVRKNCLLSVHLKKSHVIAFYG